MSRENVAAEIGVTTKTLYTWEMRSGPIKWDNAKQLAAFYDVAPDSLVTRDADEAAGLPSREQLDRIEATFSRVETKLDALIAFIGATSPDVDPGTADLLRDVLPAGFPLAAQGRRRAQ